MPDEIERLKSTVKAADKVFKRDKRIQKLINTMEAAERREAAKTQPSLNGETEPEDET